MGLAAVRRFLFRCCHRPVLQATVDMQALSAAEVNQGATRETVQSPLERASVTRRTKSARQARLPSLHGFIGKLAPEVVQQLVPLLFLE
jgi:hypothetical protein